METKEIRCPYCNRLLGKVGGHGEIKCNRCKKIIKFNTQSVNRTPLGLTKS